MIVIVVRSMKKQLRMQCSTTQRGCEDLYRGRSGRQRENWEQQEKPIAEPEELSEGRGNSINKGPEAVTAPSA